MRTAIELVWAAMLLAACNLPSATEQPAPAAGIIRGVLWSDQCRVDQSTPDDRCSDSSSGAFGANGLREGDEPGIAGVTVELGRGSCPSSGLDRATTGSDGSYAFIGREPGEYCVSIDPQEAAAGAALGTGSWTAGGPAQSVQLSGGQDLAGVDFGWQPAAAEPSSTATPVATPTPTAETNQATAQVNANCRRGPGIVYEVLGVLLAGQTVEAMGRDSAGDWWQVQLSEVGLCWLSDQTVEVNFNAADLPELTPPPTPTASPGSIQGRVWHDRCGVTGEEGGTPPTPSPGCIELDGGGYGANGVFEAGEPGLVGVLVNLGSGACPARGLASTITASDGLYAFSGLSAGTYCVSVDALGAINSTILVPGGWTRPPNVGEITITVGAGEQLGEVNFGWDYQFLP